MTVYYSDVMQELVAEIVKVKDDYYPNPMMYGQQGTNELQDIFKEYLQKFADS